MLSVCAVGKDVRELVVHHAQRSPWVLDVLYVVLVFLYLYSSSVEVSV